MDWLLRRLRSFVFLAAVVLLLSQLAGCAGTPDSPSLDARRPVRHPWLVVGIDGAEWRVIHQLWEQGELPNLKALAERGLATDLRTNYGASPVIWTTIATGMTPDVHGITDFVVPTDHGDIPVSSGVRQVPAIWNMASYAGRRVAVLGWWASWPAESVDGLVVSDRLAREQLDERVYPPEALPRVETLLREARAEGEENPFFGNEISRLHDRVTARLAAELVGEGPHARGPAPGPETGYDLVLAYFRGVDIVSHDTWKYFRPGAFPDQDLTGAAPELARRIPEEYAAVDAALGELLRAAGDRWNVLVISDHGFHAARPEIVRAFVDFDRVLERLGYLQRRADGSVDFERSKIYTHASPDFRPHKTLRFGDAMQQPDQLAACLQNDLARITWSNGAPALRLRPAGPGEARDGVDLVVEVQLQDLLEPLLLDGEAAPLAGVLTQLSRISGTHGQHTHGILLAAGPDVAIGRDGAVRDGAVRDGAAPPERIRIHDITPTLLYGLGLPVAENFAGVARTELFSQEFRRRSPLRTVPAWDLPASGVGGAAGGAQASPVDGELERELRALGYL